MEYLPLFEVAANEALERTIVDRRDGEDLPDIQCLIKSDQSSMQLREVASDHVNRLIKVTTDRACSAPSPRPLFPYGIVDFLWPPR